MYLHNLSVKTSVEIVDFVNDTAFFARDNNPMIVASEKVPTDLEKLVWQWRIKINLAKRLQVTIYNHMLDMFTRLILMVLFLNKINLDIWAYGLWSSSDVEGTHITIKVKVINIKYRKMFLING